MAAVVGVRRLSRPTRTNAWTRDEEETNWSPPRRDLLSCRALSTYHLGSGNHDWGRGLVAGAKSFLALSLALAAQDGHVPIRASFCGHSRTAQGMPRWRRLRASIGRGAAVALSNGSTELEPPPLLTMMFVSERFKSLRERILPSGAVLSRGRGALFRKADPDVAPPDVSIGPEVIGIPPGGEGRSLGRLRFDCGVEALDLGFEAANFVLEFEDPPDPGDVDAGVGQGGDLA